MRKFLLSFVMLLCASGADAGVISANFRTAADLPYCCEVSGPRTAEYSGAVHAGFEIDGATPVSNPSGWAGGAVYVDLDPTTGLLTLDSQDRLDFQRFVLTIDHLRFEPGQYLRGLHVVSGELADIAPQLSFTGDSLRIRYDTRNIFLFTGGSALFQLDIGTRAVPEPAGMALFGLAFAGLAAVRRRRS